MSKLIGWFNGLSQLGKVAVVGGASLGMMTFAGAASSQPAPTAPAAQQEQPKPITKTEVQKEVITYSSSTQNDPGLEVGNTSIQTAGKNGEKTITHTITLVDGKETARKTSEPVTTPAVNEVILVGTKPKPVVQAASSNCDPNYSGCVPIASDVDCAGGSGNGPAYVAGPVRVIGRDIYDLDRNGDGYGCE